MKDAEFIELLNLYLDHEISAADAARLEAEVQRSSARRQLYRQYCQMQKACSLLAQDFATEAPAQNVVAFEQQPRRTAWAPVAWGLGGLAAAAACVAVIFAGRNHQVAPLNSGGDSVAQITTPAPAPVPVFEPQPARPVETDAEARAFARSVVLPTRRSELQPVMTMRALQMASAPVQVPQEFQWMNATQLSPIAPATAELRINSTSGLKQAPAIFRSQPSDQAKVEMTAFQFQK